MAYTQINDDSEYQALTVISTDTGAGLSTLLRGFLSIVTAVHVRAFSVLCVLSSKEHPWTLTRPGILPLNMHTHRLRSHNLQLHQWVHQNRRAVHSSHQIKQLSGNINQKGKIIPECISHERQRKLFKSIKTHCLPDVHSKSIIHSPTIKCLVSGRHWGPRDGSRDEQKQTDHAHGATVHKRRGEELFLRHFNVERCSISFSRKR